ncbi:hypothetical protein B0O99DRAFT_621732 [Bisporella sp. PMI_857]|nr:hypothetical protein B0O99DRAFT_621732 [Bisporella sp. PMI_857]
MKLRLRLANYKVETKQINVPLAQLRLETKTSKPSNLPRFSSSLTTGKPRTPLPDTIPDIRIRRPSSEKAHPVTHMPSSPPPRYLEIVSGSNISPRKEELVTPLLPRQREDIAGRLAGESPTRKDPSGRDLTSSIVKQKTAADSLLDLMRQSDYSRSF